jgi:hypothetical protein
LEVEKQMMFNNNNSGAISTLDIETLSVSDPSTTQPTTTPANNLTTLETITDSSITALSSSYSDH